MNEDVDGTFQDPQEAADEAVTVDQNVYSGDLIVGRLNAIEAAQMVQGELLDKLVEGVNNIGGMMNEVADAFGQIMDQVSKGGIGALLGGMMGKKNNGD